MDSTGPTRAATWWVILNESAVFTPAPSKLVQHATSACRDRDEQHILTSEARQGPDAVREDVAERDLQPYPRQPLTAVRTIGFRSQAILVDDVSAPPYEQRTAVRAVGVFQIANSPGQVAGVDEVQPGLLTDFRGAPLPREPYVMLLPDGLVKAGLSDVLGEVHEEHLASGLCDVELPEHALMGGREPTRATLTPPR